MPSLEELIVQQEHFMRSVSRALQNFKKLGQAKWTYHMCRQRLAALNATFAKCQELDIQLNLTASDAQKSSLAYFVGNHFLTCEEMYNDAADIISEVQGIAESSSAETNPSAPRMGEGRSLSHLPRPNLPSFDGTLEQWETFRDRFRAMIMDNRTLTNVERLHYLCSCLTGEASRALSHLALTDSNFEVAWGILVSRFENKRRLITMHVMTLIELSQLTSENVADLNAMRDRANSALKNLGRPVKTWNDILVVLVSQKLDRQSRKA